ncbi:MAG: DEAD/DEAH box helicase [Planctomycetes bacterium]|nr:DEAD/DEAH box helicase [Planctomycetota bacterium]
MPTSLFHPVVADWFAGRFSEPTEAQRRGWPRIVAGEHTLVAAPTGSGKTLAAFLASIDSLLRQAIDGNLPDETQVVYVSPLKALSNDIHRNLQVPLHDINDAALAAGFRPQPIRVAVRTGDTPSRERQAMLRKAAHILVTTPESLYLLLTGSKSREMLRNVRTVIVDEIHALARDKRGSHLALSLARLDRLCDRPPTRVGLSATQRPIDEIARFLVGSHNVSPSPVDASAAADATSLGETRPQDGQPRCHIIDTGHVRELDLAIEVPPSELSAVCSHEQWQEIYARLSTLIREHRSTLVFVNTRRLAERVCHYLEEQLGEGQVASHHGSLSREIRLRAEEQLKSGQLKAIVATASLELGIDIGFIDLVCQIGSPRSIATFLQRVGRAGHALGRIPKGRLFALTRDELLEAMALIRAVRTGKLDRIEMPAAPLDILAQQVVASVACEDFHEDELFALCREAWPFRDLERADFDAVVTMLSDGITLGNRTGAYLHRDRINHKLRPRRSARISAITSGGAIPETADYRVVTEGERTFVGTLNEDFAIESQAGNVFQLGNTSWRIHYVRGGEVVVSDAHGAPATVPFWLGEAPGRTAELSAELSQLRADIWRECSHLAPRDESPLAERENHTGSLHAAADWLKSELSVDDWAAAQAANYVASQGAAIGLVPTQQQVVFERFFDESGGMQLVVHAPFGARINRAWGLTMRKCFCRAFDFELQAIADDNGIVLSIGPQQSFPLEQMFTLVDSATAKQLLIQALLAVPMFQIRWRWNVTRALAVLRQRGGKKVPPHLQRHRADDLLTAVFPAQTQCFEHRTGDLEPPDHPIVQQSVHDCLQEAMDFTGWLAIMKEIEAGRIELVGRDTREPSPFSHQLLNANPYAFLDDAPLEERRTRAVSTRRTFAPEDVSDLGKLDAEAIATVRAQASPLVRDAEELHDTLLSVGALAESEGAQWRDDFDKLVEQGRAVRREVVDGPAIWIAVEEWPAVSVALSLKDPSLPGSLPASLRREVSLDDARQQLVRGRLEISGPTTAARIAQQIGMKFDSVQIALEQLELSGFVLRGRFTVGPPSRGGPFGAPDVTSSAARLAAPTDVEWCERRLLARIHRLTLDGLRRQVAAVDIAGFMRFVLAHHGVSSGTRSSGPRALQQAIGQLEGFESPAAAWEHDLLPSRIAAYEPQWLDGLFTSGEIVWGRHQPPQPTEDKRGQILTRASAISLSQRTDLAWLLPPDRTPSVATVRWDAQSAYEGLTTHGALFFEDLLAVTSLLPSQLEDALRELAALGLVTSDGFAAIRALVSHRRLSLGRRAARRMKHRRERVYSHGGRWSKFPPFAQPVSAEERAERWAWLLLNRYGVMFRDLLARESVAPPWRELAPVYRRLEMRGEIRGGRFVRGVAGEQFALPDAVERLRQHRDEPAEATWCVISAADPLNLVGIVTRDSRVPAKRGNRVLFLDGRPVAARESRQVRWLAELDEQSRQRATQLLTAPGALGREDAHTILMNHSRILAS